jgi:endoglycosylceramidase
MHQDLFSAKFIDGAPEWATLDEGLEHPQNCTIWYEAYLTSPAVIKAADNFWANKPASDGVGLLDHYEAMWTHLAGRFGGLVNILGFEPMNEPFMGSLAPQTFGEAIAKVLQLNPAFTIAAFSTGMS